MTRPWSSWFPDILPTVPGCSDLLVEQELRRAAQDFFSGSYAWKVATDPVPLAAGECVVEIIPDDIAQELVKIDSVWADGKRLAPLLEQGAEKKYGDGWPAATGTPSHFMQDSPGTIRVLPIPETGMTSGISVRASVRPGDRATGLADAMYSKFRADILLGAKARLMQMAGQPWANEKAGLILEEKFHAAIGKANASAATGFGVSRISAAPTWC